MPVGISELETAGKLLEYHRNIVRIFPSYPKILKVISADQPCVDVFYQGKHERAACSPCASPPLTPCQFLCQQPASRMCLGPWNPVVDRPAPLPEMSAGSLRPPHLGDHGLMFSALVWSADLTVRGWARRGEGRGGRGTGVRSFALTVREKEEKIYKNYNKQTYKQTPSPPQKMKKATQLRCCESMWSRDKQPRACQCSAVRSNNAGSRQLPRNR